MSACGPGSATAHSGAEPRARSVAVVLSTFDGAEYLPAQLDSFVAQHEVDWTLFWRDDGSSDRSVAVMEAFAAGPGAGRCVRVDQSGHMGVTASYMALLRHAVAQDVTAVAFSDQDDVWLPGKLARGVGLLRAHPGPALYCSRQVLVDSAMHRIGESEPITVAPSLGAALTQNVATGCTVILDAKAAALVAGSRPPPPTLHDWWSYLVVAAAGGQIVADAEATVLYRQHGGNAVGAPPSRRRRALAALQRGPSAFMKVLRAHVGALAAQPDLLSPASRPVVAALAGALAGGLVPRLQALRRYGLQRQTRAETWLFRCWFLIG